LAEIEETLKNQRFSWAQACQNGTDSRRIERVFCMVLENKGNVLEVTARNKKEIAREFEPIRKRTLSGRKTLYLRVKSSKRREGHMEV